MSKEKPSGDEEGKGMAVRLGRGSYLLAAMRALEEEKAKGIHIRLPTCCGCEVYKLYQQTLEKE